jgi:hypothetical protein
LEGPDDVFVRGQETPDSKRAKVISAEELGHIETSALACRPKPGSSKDKVPFDVIVLVLNAGILGLLAASSEHATEIICKTAEILGVRNDAVRGIFNAMKGGEEVLAAHRKAWLDRDDNRHSNNYHTE